MSIPASGAFDNVDGRARDVRLEVSIASDTKLDALGVDERERGKNRIGRMRLRVAPVW